MHPSLSPFLCVREVHASLTPKPLRGSRLLRLRLRPVSTKDLRRGFREEDLFLHHHLQLHELLIRHQLFRAKDPMISDPLISLSWVTFLFLFSYPLQQTLPLPVQLHLSFLPNNGGGKLRNLCMAFLHLWFEA